MYAAKKALHASFHAARAARRACPHTVRRAHYKKVLAAHHKRRAAHYERRTKRMKKMHGCKKAAHASFAASRKFASGVKKKWYKTHRALMKRKHRHMRWVHGQKKHNAKIKNKKAKHAHMMKAKAHHRRVKGGLMKAYHANQKF